MTAYLGDSIAYRIRAELVCCYIYDEIQKDALEIDKSREPVDPADGPSTQPTSFGIQGAIGQAVIQGKWHDLCYWGEASAQIAEGRCPGYETEPNICRCSCEGCEHSCNTHQE